MKSFKSSRFGRAGVWLGLVLLVGCSALPTAPSLAPGTLVSTPEFVQSGNLLPLPIPDPVSIAKSVKTVMPIVGDIGGEVAAGPFRVVVPSNAFSGVGVITVEVPDSTMLRVEVHIDGVPNSFSESVRLEVDWSSEENAIGMEPSSLRMVWFDESAGKWRVIPSTVDESTKIIWSDLEHFSTYGVIEAKAGW